MAKMRIEWRPDFEPKVARHLQRGLARGAFALQEQMDRTLSIGQPVRRTKSGRLVGLSPSRPGQPPHVLYGRLRQSITIGPLVRTGPYRFSLAVGSNVEYAARLEFGFVGTDALGRNVSQAARPWARPSLQAAFKKLGRLIKEG